MKYEVTNGKHVAPAPGGKANTTYVEGDIVESSRPLDKIYKNKFKKADSNAVATGDEQAKVKPKDKGGAPVKGTFKAVKLKKGGWNVKNVKTRKKVNTNPLTEEEAVDLVEQMNA